MKKLTFIYIYRDRETERVLHSLNSLKCQTHVDFEVLFIDYGSAAYYRQKIETLVKSYSFCKYVYNDTYGMPWNRSHAINTGIKLVTTPYIFTADVDLVYRNDFVERLHQFSNPDKAWFFTMCYLPPDYDLKKLNDTSSFPISKDDTFGQALIPLNKLININGYDEFYCFWGKEDNDIEQRLKLSGVETEFYNKEVFLFHQWHQPSISSERDFPNGWGVFVNDYFNCKAGIIKRNDNWEWGKIFLENERQSIKMINNPFTKFKMFNGSVSFFIYELSRQFNNLSPQETLCLEFNDINSTTHLQSRLGKTISFLQKIFDKLKIPVRIVSQFRCLYTTVFDVRDEAIIFILSNKEIISDYCLLITDKELKLVILKESLKSNLV